MPTKTGPYPSKWGAYARTAAQGSAYLATIAGNLRKTYNAYSGASSARKPFRRVSTRRFARSYRRPTRSVRKPLRFRRLRRGRAKKSLSSYRKRLINVLAAPDYYALEVHESAIVDPSDATIGQKCKYFCFAQNSPYGSQDPVIMRIIADKIAKGVTIGAFGDMQFEQTKFGQKHVITSCSNFDITLRGWLLECRRDLPNVAKYSQGTIADLGRAFAAAGIDNANASATNTGLTQMELNPFMARSFLLDYKICRSFSKIIAPGQSVTVSNSDYRPHMVYPLQFLSTNATQTDTYLSAAITVFDRRKERYWLFRIESKQLGVNSSNTQIADTGCKILMTTKTMYQYKFVPNLQSITSYSTPFGIGAPVAPTNIINNETNSVVPEVSSF